jgi:hypothetical protein
MVELMPTEKSMMTVKQLFDACRRYKSMYSGSGQTPLSKIRENKSTNKKEKVKNIPFDIRHRASTGMTITSKKIIEDEDEDGDIYRKVTCKVKHNNGSGRTHTVEFIFYGPGDEAQTKCAADCSCEFYLYSCEVALWHEGSSRLEEPFEMRIWSNGEEYSSDGPNPQAIPVICKHIYGALLAGAAKWLPRGMRIEDRRKLEAKERRRQKREEEAKKKKEIDKKKKETDRKKLEKSLDKFKDKNKIKKESAPKKDSGIKKPPEIKQPKKYATPPATKWTKKK